MGYCCCEPSVPVYCEICTDDFNRTDSANIVTGAPCNISVSSGTPSIQSNKLKIDDANTLILIDEDISSSEIVPNLFKLKLTYTFTIAANNIAHFIFDYTDSNNYFYIVFDVNNNKIEWRKVISGVDTLMELAPLVDHSIQEPIDFSYWYDQLTDDYTHAALTAGDYVFEIFYVYNKTGSEFQVNGATAGINYHQGFYVQLKITNVTNDFQLTPDARYYNNTSFTLGQTIGIGTPSGHSGNLLIDEININLYGVTLLDENLAPNIFCVTPDCSICQIIPSSHASERFNLATDDPATSPFVTKGQLYYRLCALDTISGTPSIQADYIELAEGDFIIFPEEDPHYDQDYDILILLDVNANNTTNQGNNGLIITHQIDVVFGYVDSNNYYFFRFEYTYDPDAEQPNDLYIGSLYRRVAGSNTLLEDKLTLQKHYFGVTGTFEALITISLKEAINAVSLTFERIWFGYNNSETCDSSAKALNSTPINNLEEDLADHKQIHVDSFWRLQGTTSLNHQISPDVRTSGNHIITLPSSPVGPIGLKVTTFTKDVNTTNFVRLKQISIKRNSFACSNDDWWDFCDARTPPKGYSFSLTIADSGFCASDPLTGTYLLDRVTNNTFPIVKPGSNYYNNLQATYFVKDIPACNNGGSPFINLIFEIHIVITAFTATTISVEYSLAINGVQRCYSATATYNFLAFDCHNTSIILSKNATQFNSLFSGFQEALNDGYQSAFPSTITIVPTS